MRLYDAHNHLHDERLKPHFAALLPAATAAGVRLMVVNGSSEHDWPEVLALARQHPQILPAFGYHPWSVKERSAEWQKQLRRHLDAIPSAIGEIGLDRWIEGYDWPRQEEMFAWQMELAAERDLPASIHCLQAWGALFDQLRKGPRPARGFLLHSYGGPKEMVEPLARLGAYFSFPGYFAHERKLRQREAFARVPADRLLIETDAPDQPLPPERIVYPLPDTEDGRPVNHPANLRAIYEFVAEMLREPLDVLAERVEENFLRLFGSLLRPPGAHT